jgi:Zn-finger nucleic acid-binding protein
MPRCPSCFGPLTRVEESEIKSAVCGNCFGTWINAGALLRRVQKDASEMKPGGAASAAGPQPTMAELAEIVQTSNSQEVLRCGECDKLMEKGRFHPMIPVTVDRCKACGYLWLDAGELGLVRKLYAELMTSEDPEIVSRRDRIGEVAATRVGLEIEMAENREARERRRDHHKAESTFDLLIYLLRSVK